MAREEVISRKSILDFIKECSLGGWVELPEEQWNEFVLSLPSVNPQEPILDKIRSEVEQYNLQPSNYPCNMISIGTVLQIIDKYRGEE